MIKRLLSIVLIGLALISSAPCFAEIASGTSGTCKWSIDDKGVLTIEPTKGNEGKLANWLSEERVPWYKHRLFLRSIHWGNRSTKWHARDNDRVPDRTEFG